VKTALVVCPNYLQLPSIAHSNSRHAHGAVPAPTLLDKARSGSLAEMLALLVRIPVESFGNHAQSGATRIGQTAERANHCAANDVQLPWEEDAETNVASEEWD